MNHRAARATALILGALILRTCLAAEAPSVVPIKLLGNFPVLMANIDGKSIPLIFDLGDDSSLVLTKAARDQVAANPTAGTFRFLDAMGHVIKTPMYKVTKIQIGSAIFTDVIGRLDAHDPSYPSQKVGQAGYLGTFLLKSYEVVLDYRRKTMTLIPPDGTENGRAACKGSAVPFSAAWKGEPVTEAVTDIGELTLVWDTGAPVSLIRKTRSRAADMKVDSEWVTMKRLSLGGEDFGPLEFHEFDHVEPAGTDGFIGYNFFATHIVCVDFPGRQFLIQR